MRKLFLIILSGLFLGGCNLKLFKPSPAGLEILTNPNSSITLDGADSGTTPYSNQSLKAGSYVLKLTPSSPDLPPYETKIDLSAGTSTVISHTFASSPIDSSGYILQLVEGLPDDSHLSVISDPDMVNVNLDGVPSGFTPLSKLAVSPGSHTLNITSPGFTPQEIGITTRMGYNLIVNVKLAPSTITLTPPPPASSSALSTPTPSSSPATSPSPSPAALTPAKPYVVIGETETGWLRVRADASSASTELGKANTGEKLKYLGVTTDTGWHKVEFEDSAGYVSAKYSTLIK